MEGSKEGGKEVRKEGRREGRKEGRRGGGKGGRVCMHILVCYCKTKHATVGQLGLF